MINPVLMFRSEIWVLTERVINQLSIFERKILMNIYRPIRNRGEWWLWCSLWSPGFNTDIKVNNWHSWAIFNKWSNEVAKKQCKILQWKTFGWKTQIYMNRWCTEEYQKTENLRITNWCIFAGCRKVGRLWPTWVSEQDMIIWWRNIDIRQIITSLMNYYRNFIDKKSTARSCN